ncbi:molybdopterin-containing oxidoreductase family protein [Pyrobaculum calidifontis]|uniref:Molybdopterin oxidoreductase n=1 Tax=Pyrobaculum calidifontis (strain DSM 21063 / JCM 11548 / VA1) TaxID=410359 RepID=A3MWB0_PYRCJ|nr:molybdopterin-dependent oxidoreductase [Pyrobaculum calidifontis]ABO08927.1 molybdopterin oxidoreductase [Pyrobaculum calidifontis JCM 11548]
MSISRRDVIKAGITIGIVGGVAGVLIKAAEQVGQQAPSAVKVTSVPSICGMCMAQCAIYVDVANGKPVRIRPNTNAPTSAMGICARGVSGTFSTWLNPDAIKKPMARRALVDWAQGKISWEEAKRQLSQNRGKYDDFVEVDWNTAIEIIAKKLKELADNNERHAFTFLFGAWGPTASMRAGVPISRFADTFGGGIITFDNPYCTYPRYLGHWLTWGHGHQAHTVCVDYGEAEAILVVRRNVIGAGVVTETWRFMEAVKRGAKLVVLSPVFDETASYADVWLPVKPGTDLAVLLAFIKYILDNGYYAEPYLVRYTNAPFLIRLDNGIPLLASEVDWAKYGASEPKAFAYVVWDAAANAPAPDNAAAKPALFGEYEVQLKDGTTAKVKTALTILKEWVDANLAALAKKHGVADYMEAAAKEADVSVEDLRKAAEIVAKHRAVAPIGWHDPRYSNSPQTWRAVGIVMALLGRIQQPGGIFLLTHLIMPYSDIYTKVLKYTRKDVPYKTIRGATFSEYVSANLGGIYVIPVAPPLPGPSDRGAPPVPALVEKWAEEAEKKGYLYPYDTVQALYESVVHGKPFKTKVVFIVGSNPIPQIGNSRLVEQIFRELDLVIVHDIQFNDTTAFADLILPDLPYLERMDLALPGPFSPFPAISVRFPWYYEEYMAKIQQGAKPGELDKQYRSRDGRTIFEVLLMIARRLQQLGVKARDGTDWSQNMPVGMITEDGIFPITNLRNFINATFRRIRIVDEQGNVRAPTVDDLYKMGGYMVLVPTGRIETVVDERWSQALGREVKVRVHVYKPVKYDVSLEQWLWRTIHYNAPITAGTVPFPTPSGRVEIYSINLAYDVSRVFGKPATSIDPSDLEGTKSGVDPLFSPVPLYAGMARPDYMWATAPPTPDIEVNGLVPPQPPKRLLLVYRHGPYTHTHSHTQNNMLLNTLTPDELLTAWIHPSTAAALGVKDGDWIEVRPAAPKVLEQLKAVGAQNVPTARFKVRVTNMVRPDIIAIYHYWLVPKGRLRVKAAKLADIRAGDSDDNYFGAMMAGKLGTPGAMGNTVVEVVRV